MDIVGNQTTKPQRVFKTAWFARAARKAHILDEELCSAIRQVVLGQADDLGGGVFKKGYDKISTVPSFWREPGTIGSMSIYSPSRSGPISRTMNSLTSAS